MQAILQSEPELEHSKLYAVVHLLKTVEDSTEKTGLIKEFYDVVRSTLVDRCHKVACQWYKQNPEWVQLRDDLVTDTFILAVHSIKRVELEPNWDEETCLQKVNFWIDDIANEVFLEFRKENQDLNQTFTDYNDDFGDKEEEESIGTRKSIYKYDTEKFKKIIDGLSPLALDVLKMCLKNNTLGENNQKHNNDDDIDELVKKHSTTKEAIRQTKHRVIKLIRGSKLIK